MHTSNDAAASRAETDAVRQRALETRPHTNAVRNALGSPKRRRLSEYAAPQAGIKVAFLLVLVSATNTDRSGSSPPLAPSGLTILHVRVGGPVAWSIKLVRIAHHVFGAQVSSSLEYSPAAVGSQAVQKSRRNRPTYQARCLQTRTLVATTHCCSSAQS